MTVKIIELVGTSPENFGEAVENAVERASRTIRNISGVDIIKFSAKTEKGKIVEYRANVKIAFTVEDGEGV
ncbi:dodecin family protein [Patescibacteria group bacterium]|nr:dodecin family protein [Patescibacteria group bacterium]MBU1868632.1 dodecin family protein [Patescibacteria group bacterium]